MPYKEISKQREYSRLHYKNNKKRYLERNSENLKKLKKYIQTIKESSPCSDCHVSYPYYVMDFDHQHGKEGLIIDFVRRNNRTALENEIKKCELVCSNCHRIRTFKKINGQK